MNYYIRGNKEKADQIKAAFERNGIDTSANSNYGISNLFYFSCNGEVAVTQNRSTINIIKTHPDYTELELRGMTMTREEQIIKIGAQFAIDETDGQTSGRAASMRGVLLSAFRAGAHWADSCPNWISVEDELPPENGKTQQSISVWATDGLTSGEFRYNFDTKTWTDMWGDPFNITHWIQRPQLPRKED